MAENITQSTTQQFLDIHDITNDLVIMKDGTTSLILSVDAMNFGLLAEEEQDSIIYAYAGLLNSLNYPIQVLVKSQTKDVTTYLKLLQEQEALADSPENRQRIRRYREFVGNLIHERNVLDKKFYVVIPALPLELGLLSAQSVLPGQKTFDVTSVERSVLLDKAKNILEPKRDHLISQFARIGLNSRQLGTQEIIQYFYVSYNPEASEGQEIADSNSYSTPLVKASFEGYSMPQNNQPTGQQAAAPAPQAPLPPTDTASPITAGAPIQAPTPVENPNPQPPATEPAPAPAPEQPTSTPPSVQPEQTTDAEVAMPPGTTVPEPSQTNGQIPVEKQPIQPPASESAPAPEPPATTPPTGEVNLPPNQDQRISGTPQVDPEQSVAQDEINKTLGALDPNSTNQIPPLENPAAPAVASGQEVGGDNSGTGIDAGADTASPPPIAEIK